MRILFICLSLLLTLSQTFGQIEEPTIPELTEIWQPKPKKVRVATNQQMPPSDAIVLFNGTNLNQWDNLKGEKIEWEINPKEKSVTVKKGSGDIRTKESFGSVQLHIEWRTPKKVEREGQDRGNSGVFLQERYEVQILDNHGNETYVNGQAGSVYKQYPPLVNACKLPGEWQTYDIIFHSPKFGKLGNVTKNATLTVLHNGVLVQDHAQLLGTTVYIGWPKNSPHGKAPIRLQDHSSEVSYRNIWLRKLD